MTNAEQQQSIMRGRALRLGNMNARVTCHTCLYFQDCECRRHAPHMLLLRENRITVWPLVTPDKWCGDYTEKTPDAPATQS